MDVLERVFGSLFVWQLTRDGRGVWPTVARCLVVALVAGFLAMTVQRVYANGRYPREVMPEKFAEFQAAFTIPCLNVIFYGCLALTPGLFSPLLARDRESRLLDLLLTTQLTRDQIVLGRWGVRFVQLLMLFAAAIPVLIVSYTFGGARIDILLEALAVALCASISLSAIATLASAIARTTREAFALAYAVPVIVGMTPYALSTLAAVLVETGTGPSAVVTAARSAAEFWNRYVSPIGVFHAAFDVDVFIPRYDVALRIAVFMVIHLSLTLILWRFAVAAIALGGDGAGQQWLQFRSRLFKRRAHDFRNAPIFLREWRSGPSGIWTVVQRYVFVVSACFGLYLPFYCFIFKPFRKLWFLFGDWRDADYLPFYLWTGGALSTFAILQVLQNAGNAIAAERDHDTWQTLLSTRLTAGEIVCQKVLAALRPALTLLILWIPLTLLLVAKGHADVWCIIVPCVAVPGYALFVAAVTFWTTLQSRSSWNGMMQAMAISAFVFAVLTVIQVGEVSASPPTKVNFRRVEHEPIRFTDGVWALSSPFLLTPVEHQPDPRWKVIFSGVVLFVMGLAILISAVEVFPMAVGRPERGMVQRTRPPPTKTIAPQRRPRTAV
jgi:ABC-type transport system involved in multi-copper enzyme maturation permease subunit